MEQFGCLPCFGFYEELVQSILDNPAVQPEQEEPEQERPKQEEAEQENPDEQDQPRVRGA